MAISDAVFVTVSPYASCHDFGIVEILNIENEPKKAENLVLPEFEQIIDVIDIEIVSMYDVENNVNVAGSGIST